MLGIYLCLLRSQLLQTVDQTAEAPCPLTIGTIVLQLGIKTVEVVLAALVMRAPLTIVVYLLLMEYHRSDRSVFKQLFG